MTITTDMFVFDCPVHGPETGLFCFRALKHENRHLWTKYQATLEPMNLPDEELDELLKWHRATKIE